jgi:acyl-coenzyme A synthetase/AMP-(fatty) acid ligase
MMGQIVTARVTLRRPLEEASLRKLIRKHCRARLAPYKIPARIEIADEPLTTGRQKKVRR